MDFVIGDILLGQYTIQHHVTMNKSGIINSPELKYVQHSNASDFEGTSSRQPAHGND